MAATRDGGDVSVVRVFATLLALVALVVLMSAMAWGSNDIKLSQDGKSVFMPVDTFIKQELYIEKIESENQLLRERVKILEDYKAQMDEKIKSYAAEVETLRGLYSDLQGRYDALLASTEWQGRVSKYKWGLNGALLGFGIGYLVGD